MMKDLMITDVRVHPGDSGFLIDDGETAVLYDSGFAFTGYELAENIRRELGERTLNYILLSHSHYDHAAGSVYVKRLYPGAKVIAGEYAAKIFSKPTARATMRDLDHKVAASCGIYEYEDLIDELRVDITVRDGDIIEAGKMRFQAVALPGHTRCSMGFYETNSKLLLGSETLGNYDGEVGIIPAYLVGYRMTLDSIEKARGMDIENILLPHYGLLPEDKVRWYFDSVGPAAEEIAEAFKDMIMAGKSDEELVEYYKEKFYRGVIRISYPEAAMEMNTRILAQLIRRELCEKTA